MEKKQDTEYYHVNLGKSFNLRSLLWTDVTGLYCQLSFGEFTILTWIVPTASGVDISLPGTLHQLTLPPVLLLLRYHRVWTQVADFHPLEVLVEIRECHPVCYMYVAF